MELCGLPEDCISHAISFTSPRDACRSAAVSAGLRAASTSDAVWEKFLPADCAGILARAVFPPRFSSKRDLYFRLCQPLLLDQGQTSFWLEKSSGKQCYMISARALTIVWGDTEYYWRWAPLPESRFSEVAELLNVCWLEIEGKFSTRMLSSKTWYAAYLVIKIHPDAYGLDACPARVSVKLGGNASIRIAHLRRHDAESTRMHSFFGVRQWHRLSQNRIPGPEPTTPPVFDGKVPQSRADGWMEIELGEFYNDIGEDGEVEMTLMETKGGNWKRGLIIEGIEIRPKAETGVVIIDD